MNATCGAPECDRSARVRGMCQMHYQRAYKAGVLEAIEAECVDCGVAIADRNGGRKRCTTCVVRFNRARQSAWHKANPRPKKAPRVIACHMCGGETPLTTRAKRKCTRCAQESAVSACREDDCGRPARARQLCAMHYKRAARAEGRIADVNDWTERRQANHERRRALKLGATVGEPFTNIEIFERDGWECGLCGQHVDRELRHPDPLSPSLDHVVPLSVGGAHARENVQLAHLTCNVRKGNRAQGEQLALIG